jgi:hypothetical protein
MAGSRDRRLEREVFEKALARAIELDADGEGLSEQDLIEAGRELGITDRLTLAALREVEGDRTPPPLPKPPGSRLELAIDPPSCRLSIPAGGLFRPRTLVLLVWVVGWFAGLGFWTRQVVGLGPAFLLLTVFFWVLGLRMLGVFVLAVGRRQELRLGPDAGVIASQLGPVEWHQAIDPRKLKCDRLLEGYSEPELRWVDQSIDRWLADQR